MHRRAGRTAKAGGSRRGSAIFVETIRGDQATPPAPGVRNDGFSAAVSGRALMSRWPMAGSFAQAGIRPQRSMAKRRSLFRGPDDGDVRVGRRVVAGARIERPADEAHELVQLAP